MALTAAVGNLPGPKEKIVSYLEFNFKDGKTSHRHSVSGQPPSSATGGKRGAGQTQFTPRENKLFDNLQKYNDNGSTAPQSIGNPLVIRAVASKLDYDANQFSFAQKEAESRNQEKRAVTKTEPVSNPVVRQNTKELKSRLKFSETYKLIKENRDINL